MTAEFKNEFTWGNALAANSTQEFHENFEKAVDEAKMNQDRHFRLSSTEKRFTQRVIFQLILRLTDELKLQTFQVPLFQIQKMQSQVQENRLSNGVIFHFKNELRFLGNVQITLRQRNSSWLQ